MAGTLKVFFVAEIFTLVSFSGVHYAAGSAAQFNGFSYSYLSSNDLLGNASGHTAASCASWCAFTGGCISGNFQESTGICQLLDISKDTPNANLDCNLDWWHFSESSLTIRNDPCSRGACHPGTCDRSCDQGNLVYSCDCNGNSLADANCRPITKTVNGDRWKLWWWWVGGTTWPDGYNDVFQDDYGSCRIENGYCFNTLPKELFDKEDTTEILAEDAHGRQYRWAFDSANEIAHGAWLAFTNRTEVPHSSLLNNQHRWNPSWTSGSTIDFNGYPQDSLMYRVEHGVRSFMLDDDHCDCWTTLQMGHSMCNGGQSNGRDNILGVDNLYDPGCNYPENGKSLYIYFKDDDDCAQDPCAPDEVCIDGIFSYQCL